jgi:hypothetical protein
MYLMKYLIYTKTLSHIIYPYYLLLSSRTYFLLHILYINSLGMSVCLSELVHFDPLTVFARPILQPPR